MDWNTIIITLIICIAANGIVATIAKAMIYRAYYFATKNKEGNHEDNQSKL